MAVDVLLDDPGHSAEGPDHCEQILGLLFHPRPVESAGRRGGESYAQAALESATAEAHARPGTVSRSRRHGRCSCKP